MTAISLDLSDEKLRRLEVVAHARGISVAQHFDEMSSVMIAEADAETRLRLRARRGAGREARGLALLDKAAGQATGAPRSGH